MFISLRNQQNVNFKQRISSKISISGLHRLKVDFMLPRDGKDVDITEKGAKC